MALRCVVPSLLSVQASWLTGSHSCALRSLCALFQSGHDFSAANVERTLEPGRAIRAPALAPIALVAAAAAAAVAPQGPPPLTARPLPVPPARSSTADVRSGAAAGAATAVLSPSECPVALELRPVPLRARQASRLRCLVGTPGGVLWAGPSTKGGVLRYPDVSGTAPLGSPLGPTPASPPQHPLAGAPPPALGAAAAVGEDPDSEPCAELLGAPSVSAANGACLHAGGVLCLLVDTPRGLLWSGHADGRVASWRAEPAQRGQAPGMGAGTVACWQAHKGALSCLALTADGALWTGGKGGTLRVWHAGIALAGPSSSSAPSGAAAALAGALAGPPVADGARTLTRRDGNKPHGELRHLAVVQHGAREFLWSAGGTAFIIWDPKTYTALRVLNPDGSAIPDMPAEVSEAAQASSGGGFLGRMAKAVERRVARANEYLDGADVGSAQGGPRICAMAAAPWGGVVACLEGGVPGVLSVAGRPNVVVQRYAADGTPSESPLSCAAPARCLLASGTCVWAGLASGAVMVLEADSAAQGQLRVKASWLAHKTAICSLAAAPGRVLSLADDGSIRGWAPDGLPQPAVAAALARGAGAFTQPVTLRLFNATWNVAEKRPDARSLRAWLGGSAGAGTADLACFGLQEIEKLGAGSVSASAAKELVGLGDSLNANGVWWQSSLLCALEDASPGGGAWEALGARQLSGMLVLVYARKRLSPFLGASQSASAACGVLGVGGNKGGVGVKLLLHRRTLAFVNCHLAAHQGAVRKRNSDVEAIMAGMLFDAPLSEFWRAQQKAIQPPAREPQPPPPRVSGGGGGDDSGDEDDGNDAASAADAGAPKRCPPPAGGLGDADLLVFLGDTNYRIDLNYEEALAAIGRGELAWLAKHDQCLRERCAGRVFTGGLQEGPLNFAPTYKFDKGAPGPLAYDSSEKRRVPAWCDRVLWADGGGEDGGGGGVSSVLESYESVPEVTESDHKPVRQLLRLQLLAVDERKRRRATLLAQLGALHAAVVGAPAGQEPPPPPPPPPPLEDLITL